MSANAESYSCPRVRNAIVRTFSCMDATPTADINVLH